MTKKQIRFCDEYLIDCNATQAAIRAGYSERTARYIGSQLLQKKEVQEMLADRLDRISEERIANAKEILIYLTSVLRGESASEIVVVESDAEGNRKANKVIKHPDESERLKAAELLAKRWGLLTDKVKIDGAVPIIITGEDEIEE